MREGGVSLSILSRSSVSKLAYLGMITVIIAAGETIHAL